MTKPVSEQALVNLLLKWTQAASDINPTPTVQQEIEDENRNQSLDWSLSLKLANNNEQLAIDMLKMLVDSNFDTGRNIHAAYQSQDFDQLLQHVHKLHGASCYVGTPKLKHLSNVYETLLKKQQYNKLEELHEQLLAELEVVNKEAERFLKPEKADS